MEVLRKELIDKLDVRSLTNILDLPDSCLVKILQCLPHCPGSKSRYNKQRERVVTEPLDAALVCRRFLQLAPMAVIDLRLRLFSNGLRSSGQHRRGLAVGSQLCNLKSLTLVHYGIIEPASSMELIGIDVRHLHTLEIPVRLDGDNSPLFANFISRCHRLHTLRFSHLEAESEAQLLLFLKRVARSSSLSNLKLELKGEYSCKVWEFLKELEELDELDLLSRQPPPAHIFCVRDALKTLTLDGSEREEPSPHWPYLEPSGALLKPTMKLRHMLSLKTLKFQNWDAPSSLPLSLWRMRGLLELSVENVRNMVWLHPAISQLTNLRALTVASDDLITIPPELGACQYLEKVCISSRSLYSLPPSIGLLSRLRILQLSFGRDVHTLPESIGRLKSLESLGIEGSMVRELPATFEMLVGLKNCQLKLKRLSSMPDFVGKWCRLEQLLLFSTVVRSLPKDIGNLRLLQGLELRKCIELESLPEQMRELTSLKTLTLDNCKLRTVPIGLGNLRSLQELSILNCHWFREVPLALTGLTGLESLSVYLGEFCASKVVNLPEVIAKLPNLRLFSGHDSLCPPEMDPEVEFYEYEYESEIEDRRLLVDSEPDSMESGSWDVCDGAWDEYEM